MSSEKTETKRLRELLDERGVEWWNETDPEPQGITMAWADERLIEYHENANGSTGYHIYNMHDLTPEQAVAATLGHGTCELEINTDMTAIRCSKCGYVLPKGTNLMDVRYCAGCGRKVVDA